MRQIVTQDLAADYGASPGFRGRCLGASPEIGPRLAFAHTFPRAVVNQRVNNPERRGMPSIVHDSGVFALTGSFVLA
jgi:hypothetical protein